MEGKMEEDEGRAQVKPTKTQALLVLMSKLLFQVQPSLLCLKSKHDFIQNALSLSGPGGQFDL